MNESMPANSYSTILAVLADHKDATVVAPGAPGALFAALDEMRASRVPAEHVVVAEQISTALHRLQWAVRNRDQDARERLRDCLQGLWTQWLDMPLPGMRVAEMGT